MDLADLPHSLGKGNVLFRTRLTEEDSHDAGATMGYDDC